MNIEALLIRFEALEKENTFLKERLAKYENPKNYRNSSMPPSKDENRPVKNQSLRTPSGKKPGGQKGRKGKTLEMTASQDTIIELVSDTCLGCGASLKDRPAIKGESRQIVAVPPIKAVYTECQSFIKVCNCGCQNIADFPKGVHAPVSYGEKY